MTEWRVRASAHAVFCAAWSGPVTVRRAGKTTKADARRMVDLVMGELEYGVKGVRSNGSVTIPRVGTFRITNRSARMGRNPRTGEPMRIKASKSLRMRPAANLRKAAGC